MSPRPPDPASGPPADRAAAAVDPELDFLLAQAPAVPIESALAGLHARMDAPPTLREELRAWPTWGRRLLVLLGVGGAIAGQHVLTGARVDIAPEDAARVLALGGAMCSLGVGVLLVSLRSAGAPRLPTWVAPLLGLLVVVPFAVSLVPDAWSGTHRDVDGPAPCLVAGGVVAAFAAGLTLLMERGDRVAPWRLLGVSMGSGWIAYAQLGLHCPSTSMPHLLLSHSVQGVAVGLVAWAWSEAAHRARR